MKTKLIAFLVLVLLAGVAVFFQQSQTPRPAPAVVSDQAEKIYSLFPGTTFTSPNGRLFHIQDLQEPTVLVHFWAAWCAVCYAEFPQLLKYVQDSNGKVALLAISLDEDYGASQKALNSIATKNKLSLQQPHLYWASDKDKNLSLHQFNTLKVPETIIVDQDRRMVDKVIGVGDWPPASVRQ